MKIYCALLSCLFLTCSAKKEMYQIECYSLNNEGYVELRISNVINPTDYQIEQASIDAIKAVLITGYSSVKCQTQKPILNTPEEKENFSKIQSSFFSKNGKWKTFIRNSLDVDNIKTEKITIKQFEIMVNKELLRKYLEEQKIIKSLNTGF